MPLRTPKFLTRKAGEEQWRIGVMGNSEVTFVLGLNLKRLNTEMARVRQALFMTLPVALLLIATGAWWLSQRALKPINALTGAVEQITVRGLDQRIKAENEDQEFSRLIIVFNNMMGHLEKSFHQAVRFSADAAHELKTPLAILQGQLEEAIQEAEPESGEQRRYSVLSEEVQRLKGITRKLLLLSRVDAGELKLNLRPLNFSEVLEAVCEDTVILAKRFNVESDLTPDIWVMADPDLIRQVVQNITSNALKYNHNGGYIKMMLRTNDKMVRFTVVNSGKGIPREERQKIFGRFYRGDTARSRKVDGVGLGLSLAQEIMRAHHGELLLENTPEGVTAFSMVLPKADARHVS